jgi:hypothetical protein
MNLADSSPPCRTSFHISGTEYVVVNDGCVKLSPSKSSSDKTSTSTVQTVPISFEVRPAYDSVDIRRDNII